MSLKRAGGRFITGWNKAMDHTVAAVAMVIAEGRMKDAEAIVAVLNYNCDEADKLIQGNRPDCAPMTFGDLKLRTQAVLWACLEELENDEA